MIFYMNRMIFYMNLPMGIISLAAVALILPKSARPRYVSLDTFGLLTVIAFLVPQLLALIRGRHEVWHSRYIQTLFAIGIVSGIVFGVIESRQKHPLVELALFEIIPIQRGVGHLLHWHHGRVCFR